MKRIVCGGIGFLPPDDISMAEGGGHRKGVCASSTIGTLKPTVIEVSVRKDLTIHEFEHTKLIGENVTLSLIHI